jgi:hypothetical protein
MFFNNRHPLGKTIAFEDKFYLVDVSSTGETVTIKPYVGDLGKISLDIRDIADEPTTSFAVYLTCPDSQYSFSPGVSEFSVPVGDYSCVVRMDTDLGYMYEPDDSYINAWVTGKSKLTVTKDQTVTRQVGGPPTIEIDAGSVEITVKAGAKKSVDIVLREGDDELGLAPPRDFAAKVIDTQGKVIVTGKTAADYRTGRTTVSIPIPKDCAPGTYTLKVTADLMPYFETISATKPLAVTR